MSKNSPFDFDSAVHNEHHDPDPAEPAPEGRRISLREQRQESLRLLGENAAGIIHELKAPLANISAYLQLMERKLRQRGIALEEMPLPIIYQELRRMSGLCRQTMELICPRDQEDQYDPAQLARDTAALFRPLAAEHGVELRLKICEPLPPVEISAGQLRRLLINLLSNAEQALRSYRQGGRISLALAEDNGDLLCAVRDNGPGMDGATLERIFDRYYTTKPEGSGLGLPLCAQIIHDCRGTLTAFSSPGEGTVFLLRLPAAPAESHSA